MAGPLPWWISTGRPRQRSEFYSSMKVAAVVVVLAVLSSGPSLAAHRLNTDLHRFRITAASMEPTLLCAKPGTLCEGTVDDILLARPFRSGDARRGAIFVFQTPRRAAQECGTEGLFVKRLIGLPGDTVRDKHHFIWINGKELSEPYIPPDDRAQDSESGVWRVPRGKYFLLGDNRGASCDSRVWGAVPKKNLLWTAVSIDRNGAIISLP